MTSHKSGYSTENDDIGVLVKVTIGQRADLKIGEAAILNEIDPAIHKAHVAVGWTAPEMDKGFPVDIDLCAFLLKQDNTVTKDEDFVFYNNLETEAGAVVHKGDITDAANKSGDHEAIVLALENLPFGIDRVAFSLTLHNAEDRQQNFGLLKGLYIKVTNPESGAELVRYEVAENLDGLTGMIVGELMREGLGWKFHAIGKGVQGGLFKIAHDYAVNVAPM